MRYVGQNFELSVALDDAALHILKQPDGSERLCLRFFEAHERQYGYHNPEGAVEIMNYRVTARGQLHPPPAPISAAAAAPDDAKPTGTRPVYFTAEAAMPTPVYDRTILAPGQSIHGPAVIEQLDATTLLYPGDTLRVDAALNLCIEVSS